VGFLFTIFEAVLSAWGWVKQKTAERLGMSEQTNADLAKQNETLEKQLSNSINPPNAADELQRGKF
jgi:hypothetical protein